MIYAREETSIFLISSANRGSAKGAMSTARFKTSFFFISRSKNTTSDNINILRTSNRPIIVFPLNVIFTKITFLMKYSTEQKIFDRFSPYHGEREKLP